MNQTIFLGVNARNSLVFLYFLAADAAGKQAEVVKSPIFSVITAN